MATGNVSPTTTKALGQNYILVKVQEIVNTQIAPYARCTDVSSTTQYKVSMKQRSATEWPQPNDFWVINRDAGPWNFWAKITNVTPPSVVGTVGPTSTSKSLLTALSGLGLVVDSTMAPAWTNITSFGANWGNLGGSNYAVFQYETTDSRCYLKGAVKKNTTWVTGDLIATLPVAPKSYAGWTAFNPTGNTYASGEILPTGNMYLRGWGGTSASTWGISFDTVSFSLT